jgi:hypothetical protein
MTETAVLFFELGKINQTKREQLESMFVSFVLKDSLYLFVYSLFVIGQAETLKELKRNIEQSNVTFDSLNVKPVFQLDNNSSEASLGDMNR